jgi:hypothetical protein
MNNGYKYIFHRTERPRKHNKYAEVSRSPNRRKADTILKQKSDEFFDKVHIFLQKLGFLRIIVCFSRILILNFKINQAKITKWMAVNYSTYDRSISNFYKDVSAYLLILC